MLFVDPARPAARARARRCWPRPRRGDPHPRMLPRQPLPRARFYERRGWRLLRGYDAGVSPARRAPSALLRRSQVTRGLSGRRRGATSSASPSSGRAACPGRALGARRRLDGGIGRHQHDRPGRAPGASSPIHGRVEAGPPATNTVSPAARQVGREAVHGRPPSRPLAQRQHRRVWRDGGARPVAQLGRAVAERRQAHRLGQLQRDLARRAETVAARGHEGGAGASAGSRARPTSRARAPQRGGRGRARTPRPGRRPRRVRRRTGARRPASRSPPTSSPRRPVSGPAVTGIRARPRPRRATPSR